MNDSQVVSGENSGYLHQIFDCTFSKATSADLDLEVREQAILTLGHILCRAAEALVDQDLNAKVLPFIMDRLQNESYRIVSIKVITMIIDSNIDSAHFDISSIVPTIISTLFSFLRKSHRHLRLSSLQCLLSLFKNYKSLPVGTNVTQDLEYLLSETDLQVLSTNLLVLSYVMKLSGPNLSLLNDLKARIIPKVLNILVENPHLVSIGIGAQSLNEFWAAIMEIGGPSLHEFCLESLLRVGNNASFSKMSHMIVAKSIAIICTKVDRTLMMKIMQQIVGLLESNKAPESLIHLGLLSIGELGARS